MGKEAKVEAFLPQKTSSWKLVWPRPPKRKKRAMILDSNATSKSGWISTTPPSYDHVNASWMPDLQADVSNGTFTACQTWEAAQHTLFQFTNVCFLAAFLIPQTYRMGALFFRITMTAGFAVSSLWSSVHFCALDWFLWSMTLAVVNGAYAGVLTYRILPPTFSLELTELYIRMFKPLKVNKKHFNELTKEACLLRLSPGETYAVEDVSPADEKLAILLRGRLGVTYRGTFLHHVSYQQFVDSPEWRANNTASGVRFQVSITAEEESLCIVWPRLKLDRVLRRRPFIKFILSNLVGKDITHKMYSLNEHIGQLHNAIALSRALNDDYWRSSMNRSASADAVNTSIKGRVRSAVWNKVQEKGRDGSTHSDSESPLLGEQCYLPVVARQFPAENPFIRRRCSKRGEEEESATSQEEMNHLGQEQLQPLLPQISNLSATCNLPAAAIPLQKFFASQPVALIPIIVPVIASEGGNASAMATSAVAPQSSPHRSSLKKPPRGVKFDETQF